MTLGALLEEFPNPKLNRTAKHPNSEDAIQTLELEAFERGFQAGWDDATKALKETDQVTLQKIQEMLLDIDFKVADARQAALLDLQPILDEMTKTLLPQVAQAGFVEKLCDAVGKLVQQIPSPTVKLCLNPKCKTRVETHLASKLDLSLEFETDDTLDAYEAMISLRNHEVALNLTDVVNDAIQNLATLTPGQTHFAEVRQTYG